MSSRHLSYRKRLFRRLIDSLNYTELEDLKEAVNERQQKQAGEKKK